MKYPRIYVKATLRGVDYVAHIDERECSYTFDTFEKITKAEYQQLRKDGIKSWGECVIQWKAQGLQPPKRDYYRHNW